MKNSIVPVERSDRGGIGIPVFVQDQTTEMLSVPFLNDRGIFTLATPSVIDARAFTATAGHGILVDKILEFANATTFMQARVLSVAVNAIEIDTPFNHSYGASDVMTRSTDDLMVDGSTTPMIFTIKPAGDQAGDINRIILIIESNSSMDFTKFGSISPLDVGCVLRIKRADGDFRNVMNFKTNGEFIENSFDHVFEEKSGGGGFGFVGRSTFNGQDKRGVTVRLDGNLNEEMQVIIQDDLSSGLTKFRMIGQGSELQE
jgi:hypothetical protein